MGTVAILVMNGDKCSVWLLRLIRQLLDFILKGHTVMISVVVYSWMLLAPTPCCLVVLGYALRTSSNTNSVSWPLSDMGRQRCALPRGVNCHTEGLHSSICWRCRHALQLSRWRRRQFLRGSLEIVLLFDINIVETVSLCVSKPTEGDQDIAWERDPKSVEELQHDVKHSNKNWQYHNAYWHQPSKK